MHVSTCTHACRHTHICSSWNFVFACRYSEWNLHQLCNQVSCIKSMLSSLPLPFHFLCYGSSWRLNHSYYSHLWLVWSSSYYFLWHWKSWPATTITPRTTFSYIWSHKAIKPGTESAGEQKFQQSLSSNLSMESTSESWLPLHLCTRTICSITARDRSYLAFTGYPEPTIILCIEFFIC